MSKSKYLICLIPCIVYFYSRLGNDYKLQDYTGPIGDSLAPNDAGLITFAELQSAQVRASIRRTWTDGSTSSMELPALKARCVDIGDDFRSDVFLNCTDIGAGLTTIMSQVKGCFRAALDAKIGLILPILDERSSTNLDEYNHANLEFKFPWSYWFDEEHTLALFKHNCPRMSVLTSAEAQKTFNDPSRNTLNVVANTATAPGLQLYSGYFDDSKAFVDWFWPVLTAQGVSTRPTNRPVIVQYPWMYLIYRLDSDATGYSQAIWKDLHALMKFPNRSRKIVAELLRGLDYPRHPFIGFHLRAETDALNRWWESGQAQSEKGIAAILALWKRMQPVVKEQYNLDLDQFSPRVYVACGERAVVETFEKLANAQGIEVVDKWSIAQALQVSALMASASGQSNTDASSLPLQVTNEMLADLSFDGQAALDYGVMLNSLFFLGNMGSAFSWTIAHARDPSMHYRGSSLDRIEDLSLSESGLSHLWSNNPKVVYDCCF